MLKGFWIAEFPSQASQQFNPYHNLKDFNVSILEHNCIENGGTPNLQWAGRENYCENVNNFGYNGRLIEGFPALASFHKYLVILESYPRLTQNPHLTTRGLQLTPTTHG